MASFWRVLRNFCHSDQIITSVKVEKILKGNLDSIPSPSMKIQIMSVKICLRSKGKHCWVLSTNFWKQKVCWHHPAMFCLITSSKLSPNSVQCSGDNIWIGISSKIQPFCPKSFGNHRFFFVTEKYQKKKPFFIIDIFLNFRSKVVVSMLWWQPMNMSSKIKPFCPKSVGNIWLLMKVTEWKITIVNWLKFSTPTTHPTTVFYWPG